MTPAIADSSQPQHPVRGGVGLYCVQAVLLLALLYVFLDGWHRDFRVPIAFSNDALEYLMQAKGTMENGWWWQHPRLSAPWGFSEVAYPSNTNVDQALVWVVSLFTRDVGLCINTAWALLVVASGLTTTACLARLGISRGASFVAGVLFALSPYALLRNIAHFSLVTYLVPISCASALLVARGRMGSFRSRATLPFVFGSMLLGFNYVYYAFFACYLTLMASLIAVVRDRTRPAWRTGLLLIATTSAATAINLAPSIAVWSRHGKPLAIEDKTPTEAEAYGLTIRHLLSPVDKHTFPPFRRWAELQTLARFPLENENSTARLGVVGAVGFLALIGTLVFRRRENTLEDSAAVLMLCALLIATTGGVGTLFSLLVSSEIRAYNRIFPFIHFFSLAAVGLMLDWAVTKCGGSSRPGRSGWLLIAVLVIGVYDQAHAAIPANERYDADRAELQSLKSFVATLEQRLPPRAMVFQLPVTGFPIGGVNGTMRAYDEAKPYLVSRALHWSFPAFEDALARWQRHVEQLSLPELSAAVRTAGFSAVLIDRDGYQDRGESMLDEIRAELPRATVADSERYLAIDVTRIPAAAVDLSMLPRLSGEFNAASIGLRACDAAPLSSVDLIGPRRGPFTGLPVEAPWFGDIAVTGWAIDRESDRPGRDVDVVLSGRAFPTFYGISRVDVAQGLNKPRFQASGFTTRIPRDQVESGVHMLVVRVIAAAGGCYYDSQPLPVHVR